MSDIRFGSMIGESDGKGDAIVMLHGLGGTSNSFAPLLMAATDYQVLRLDLPGAGRSAYQPGRTDLQSIAASVLDFLAAHSIEKAIFVGHSMGTIVCQLIAIAHPERVSGLCLYGPITEPVAAAKSALQQRADEAITNGMAEIADAVSRASLSDRTRQSNPACVAFVRESILRQDPQGYASHCRALGTFQMVDHTQITCPVALMTGSDDPVSPPAMAQFLDERLPNSTLTIVPDCGHWPMLEQPLGATACLEMIL